MPAPGPAVECATLFSGDLATLRRWRCLETSRGLSREKALERHVIGFPRAGSYVVHSPAGRLTIDALSVELYNRGAPFRTSHPEPGTDRGVALLVRDDALLEAVARHDPTAADRPETPFASPRIRSTPRAALALRRLVRAAETDGSDGTRFEEGVLRVLDVLFRPAGAVLRRERRRLDVEAVRLHLAARFASQLRLADVAAAFGVSPFHLCRAFREETGTTLHRHVTELRLSAALERLAEGAPLAAIAADVGFSSHAHLTTAFTRHFGTPPSRAFARNAIR